MAAQALAIPLALAYPDAIAAPRQEIDFDAIEAALASIAHDLAALERGGTVMPPGFRLGCIRTSIEEIAEICGVAPPRWSRAR